MNDDINKKPHTYNSYENALSMYIGGFVGLLTSEINEYLNINEPKNYILILITLIIMLIIISIIYHRKMRLNHD